MELDKKLGFCLPGLFKVDNLMCLIFQVHIRTLNLKKDVWIFYRGFQGKTGAKLLFLRNRSFSAFQHSCFKVKASLTGAPAAMRILCETLNGAQPF